MTLGRFDLGRFGLGTFGRCVHQKCFLSQFLLNRLKIHLGRFDSQIMGRFGEVTDIDIKSTLKYK